MDLAPLAVPTVYTGKSGKEYLAVVAGENPVAFTLHGRPPIPATQRVQMQLPEGYAEKLVQRVCNSCHSVGLITTHRQPREEWTGAVQRMAQHGASNNRRAVPGDRGLLDR